MADPQFSAVIGNHDLALRRRWNGEKFKLKDSQKPTHKQLKKDKEHYVSYLNSLPFLIDLGTHLVVRRRASRCGAPFTNYRRPYGTAEPGKRSHCSRWYALV